jgi:nicotinate-nucleotide pyrophosphorylase (carboxylating)
LLLASAAQHQKILDTRKTMTGGFRFLRKMAVKLRRRKSSLYTHDMITLHDNHNDFVGGISLAIANQKHLVG